MFQKGYEKRLPTEKQIDFAEKIASKLDLELPEKTMEAYGDFIAEWKDEYFFAKNYR